MIEALVLLGAYLSGSLPTGVLFGRLRGVDPREHGSGNIGATNVARTLGKKLGALTLLIDCAKGALPVLVARYDLGLSAELVAAAGGLAFLGHVFPVWLAWRGGKGVATALGVFLALAPAATGLAAAVFAVCFALFRISSLGSLLAMATLPFFTWLLDADRPTIVLAASFFAFVVFTHRGNITRLLRRSENKF